MVYKELLTIRGMVCPGMINILRANKQIHREAEGLLYSLNTFQVNIDNLDRLWLKEARQRYMIEISQKQHYSDREWTNGLAPINQWLKLPTYLGKCEKIKIVLCATDDRWWSQQQHHTRNLTPMLMHFNSLVYTRLMKHKNLHTIHVELELTGNQFSVTEEQMRDFEQGCLNTLGHLRGMRAVHLNGFACVDPFDIFLTKQGMLLPSSSWWTSFLTMPKEMQLAPQWWQLTNLSKY